MIRVITVVCFFILINTARAQQASKTACWISGQVLDASTRQPIKLATAELHDEDGKTIQTKTTGEDGRFGMEITAKGAYTLNISFIGYRTYIYAGILSGDEKKIDIGSILLQPQAGVLEAAIITKRKLLIQSKGDKLIYNASGDIGNKAGSATDVLRKAPLVTVDPDGEVKMRGSSNIKVLINGLPSGILARNLKEALKTIPASTIESIEVITMPSAKYEAEGAAGVINIVTKKKMRGSSGNIDLSAGNLEQSVNGGLNMMRGKFNLALNLNANMEKQRLVSELKRNSFTDNRQTGTLLQRSDAITRDKGAFGDLSVEYRPDSSQKLGAALEVWHGTWPVRTRLYNLYETGKDSIEYNQASNQDGKFTYLGLSVNYQKKFSRPGQELQFVAQRGWSNDHSDYLTDQYDLSGKAYFRELGPNKGGNREISLQSDYAHPLNKAGKNLLETGARYSRNSSDTRYSVFNNRTNPGSSDLQQDSSRSDAMKYFREVIAGYLSIKWETSTKWSFRPGIRYEITRMQGSFEGPIPSFQTSFHNLVPSMLISKKLNEEHEVKLNYTQRIRRPWIWDLNPYVNASDPRNLTYGNPQLRPEVTRMLEAGHNYTAPSGFTLNSSVFFNSNTNAIESLTTVDSLGISRTTSQNIAANQRLGSNINAYAQLNNDWTMNGGAEYYHVWFKSKALDVVNDADFYSLSLNTSYVLPKNYTVQMHGEYNNGSVTLQGRNSSSYTYGLSARKELLHKKAAITIGASNFFTKTFPQNSFSRASTFYSHTDTRLYNRSFSVSFTWQFGTFNSGSGKEKNLPDQNDQPARSGRMR